MSDNLKRYTAIKRSLIQLYPQAPTGHLLQSLNVLAMFINGIVASKSTHTREVAKKTPTDAKVTSREKQCSRWYQNAHVTYELHMLPFVKPLLLGLAQQTLAACRRGMSMRNFVTACSVRRSDAYCIQGTKVFSPTGC